VDAQIIAAYKSGISIAQLSKKYQLSEYKIAKLLRINNVEIRKDNGQSIKLDQDLLNQLYNSGLTCKEIAEKFACSDETIRKLITVPKTKRGHSSETLDKISKKCKEKWQNADYIRKVQNKTQTEEYRQKLARAGKKNYTNNMTEATKQRLSESIKAKWNDQDYRKKQTVYFQDRGARLTEKSKEALRSQIKRSQWIDKIKNNNQTIRALQPRISSTQFQLYYILERAGIIHHKEGEHTKVGPFYVVDCIIPKQQNMQKDLIIEVQGEYWHELKNVSVKDQQKRTCVRNHTNYDLLELKELNFACYDSIIAKLNQYGLSLPTMKIKPKQLTIKQIDEQIAKSFYQTFHYSNSIRKGALTFGAYYNEYLVAAISYTYTIRRQIATSLQKSSDEVMEISRMARATDVECKNLLSYVIGHTRKLLPPGVNTIISYSDTAYGHTGTVYKASGFIKDRVIAPDYHYESKDGIFHKKTIWDRSKRMKMTEKDYASKHDLIKVFTGEKFRWVFKLAPRGNGKIGPNY